MANAPIYFKRVGLTKTGRGLYKICDPGKGGKVYGRAFTIGKKKGQPATVSVGKKKSR